MFAHFIVMCGVNREVVFGGQLHVVEGEPQSVTLEIGLLCHGADQLGSSLAGGATGKRKKSHGLAHPVTIPMATMTLNSVSSVQTTSYKVPFTFIRPPRVIPFVTCTLNSSRYLRTYLYGRTLRLLP